MAKHCRHHDVRLSDLKHICKLGIDIRAHVGGDRFGWMRRTPCYLPNKDEPGFVPCDKSEPHTTAELEKERDDIERSVDRFKKKMDLIAQVKRERKGGTFPCPSCGGQLTISLASNGHTHGTCDKDCGSWME